MYEIELSDKFTRDIRAYKKAEQKTVLEKIDVLIDELREHPYSCTGNPEPLKYNKKGQWSRRITKKHRLIYSVDERKITVLLIAALGHYEEK
jgi:toxin YoeB